MGCRPCPGRLQVVDLRADGLLDLRCLPERRALALDQRRVVARVPRLCLRRLRRLRGRLLRRVLLHQLVQRVALVRRLSQQRAVPQRQHGDALYARHCLRRLQREAAAAHRQLP